MPFAPGNEAKDTRAGAKQIGTGVEHLRDSHRGAVWRGETQMEEKRRGE